MGGGIISPLHTHALDKSFRSECWIAPVRHNRSLDGQIWISSRNSATDAQLCKSAVGRCAARSAKFNISKDK